MGKHTVCIRFPQTDFQLVLSNCLGQISINDPFCYWPQDQQADILNLYKCLPGITAEPWLTVEIPAKQFVGIKNTLQKRKLEIAKTIQELVALNSFLEAMDEA